MTLSDRSFPLLPVSLWFLALLCAVSPFDDYKLETSTACVVFALSFGFAVLARGFKTGWVVPKSAVLLLTGAMLALVIASAAWSEVKPVTLIFIGFFAVMPVPFLAQAMAGQESVYKWMAILSVPVFAALGLWALVQNFFLNEYFWGQARHPLADPSSLGGLLCLPLLLSLAWMLAASKPVHKIIALVLALILIGGIMATVARGPWFALIPALGALGFMMRAQLHQNWKYGLGLLLGAAVLFTALALNPAKRHDLGAELANTVTLEGDISNGRFFLWRGTWEIIQEHPLLGTGFGTHFLYLPEHKDPRYIAAVHHAHNDPLQFWSELGILGPILFYAIGFAGLLRTIAAMKKLRADQTREKAIIAGGFSALTALVIQAHVSFLFYNLAILLVAGFVLAVWFYGTRLALEKDEPVFTTPESESAGMTNLIALSLPFLMIGGLFVSVMSGDYYTAKAEQSLAAQDMDGFIENINRSAHISNGLNYRSYLLAVNVPLGILMSEKSSLDEAQKRDLYNQATGYMERVLELNPRSDSAYFYLGKIQEIAGGDVTPEGAPTQEELYKKSLTLEPMNLQSRLALFNLYKGQGKSKEELLAVLQPAENMFFNSRLAMIYYQELARLYVETGNYVKGTDTLGKLNEFQKRSVKSQKRINSSVFEVLLGSDSAR